MGWPIVPEKTPHTELLEPMKVESIYDLSYTMTSYMLIFFYVRQEVWTQGEVSSHVVFSCCFFFLQLDDVIRYQLAFDAV